MQGIPLLAEERLACEGLCCMELVICQKVRTFYFCPKVMSICFDVLDSSKKQDYLIERVWRDITYREGSKCLGSVKVATILVVWSQKYQPCRSAFVLDASLHFGAGTHLCPYIIMCTFVHVRDTTD
jgi:hypothetical protein